MSEAWELTSTDERSENQITTFIIFCEDQNDEPYYFRSFQIENKLKINCITNQKNAKLNLLNALSMCKKDGLLECLDHNYQIKEDVIENIWCVYDRDLEHEDFEKIRDMDELDFSTSITTAQRAGLKVAWSNDAFELWVLLHFEMVPVGNKLHRNYVYDRLTEIFKINPLVIAAYAKSIDEGRFSYKTHLKRREAFITHVLPVLKPKTQLAIENARALEKLYCGDIAYHDCNPCTKVHLLVNDVLEAD